MAKKGRQTVVLRVLFPSTLWLKKTGPGKVSLCARFSHPAQEPVFQPSGWWCSPVVLQAVFWCFFCEEGESQLLHMLVMFAVLLINFNQPLAILAQPWTLCWKPRETKAPQITDGTAYGERERTQLGVIKPNIWEKSTLWHIRNTRTPATTTTPASLDSSTNLKHGGTGIPRRCQPRVAPSAGEGWGPPPPSGAVPGCADGDAVFDQLAGWIAEEFSGLPQSSRAALFAQMLFLPGLAFGVSCVIWPPGVLGGGGGGLRGNVGGGWAAPRPPLQGTGLLIKP